MMHATRLVWPGLPGAFLLGCASLGIRTDYDHHVAFEAYRTYAWMDSARVATEADASPFLERRVRRAVDRALGQRGFPADTAAPDLLVTAFVIGPTEDQRWRYWPAAPCGPVVSISIGVGYPYGYGLRHPRWPWRAPYFHYPWGYACAYRVGFGYLWIPVYGQPGARLPGTLVIDVQDARTHDLVWRGSAEGAIPPYDGESASQEELDDVAQRILRDFPPGFRR